MSECSAPRPSRPDKAFHRNWWARQQRAPGFELIPDICRLLADGGEPVALDRVAAAAGQSVQEVEAKLRQYDGVDWDEQGRLVGAGLTLRPTPHRFTFDEERTVYAFCATDALAFPMLLGRSGIIESADSGTGRAIRIEVTPERVVSVDPPNSVVSLVRPDKVELVRANICALGNFWESPEAAAEWLAAYPQGMLHTVADEFELDRELAESVGWTQPVTGSTDRAIHDHAQA